MRLPSKPKNNLPILEEILSSIKPTPTYSIHPKSSNKRKLINIYSNNRVEYRDKLFRNLLENGYSPKFKKSYLSSVEPIFLDNLDPKLVLIFKSKSGGMSETTINSNITETFPIMSFYLGYKPINVDEFHQYLVNHHDKISKMDCFLKIDRAKVYETLTKAPESSKYQEKMQNAMAITRYIYKLNDKKKISKIYWGQRKKPWNINSKHQGDIFIKYHDQSLVGISIKTGSTKTKEPILNTYVKPLYEKLGIISELEVLKDKIMRDIYYKIPNYSQNSIDNCLLDLNSNNPILYNLLYDKLLETTRNHIIQQINNIDTKIITTYIITEIIRNFNDANTIIIKAVDNSIIELNYMTKLESFLQKNSLKIIARVCPNSKQNWYIDLLTRNEKLVINMSIRTNKSGDASKKKLGQGYNLAVKYNGLY